jgi:hypothetical protein
MRRIQDYLDARYGSTDIRHRFRSRFGEAIDCIDFFAQPGVKALAAEGIVFDEIPKARVDDRPGNSDAPDFGAAGDPDEEGHARICPQGSVPMKRITAREIMSAGGLDAFRAAGNRPKLPPSGSAKSADGARALPATACDTQFGIDYPGYAHVQQTYNDNNQNIFASGSGVLSIHVPFFPSVPTGATLRAQLWMYSGFGLNALGCSCGGTGQPACTQSVEAGWQLKSGLPFLFTYATNDGYAHSCWGHYQDMCTDPAPHWVQVSTRYWPDMQLPSSTLFGTQQEIPLSIVYMAFAGGSWSIMTGGEVIGSFASKYFTGGMQTRAQTFQAGGEVIDGTNSWVVPMGSGAQPETGFGQAAYVHDVKACKDSGTTCVAPAAVSPVLTRPINYGISTTPAKKPGSSWANWFYYGNVPSVFWGTNYGYQWAPNGDWAVGDYKGECGLTSGKAQPLIGLSAHTTGAHQAHAVECGSRTLTVSNPTSCYARKIPPNSQGTSEDWDPGYYKASCGVNEFVLGVSQSSAGAFTGVLCCPASSGATHTNCTTQVLYNQNSSAYYTNSGADWDAGYDKGQCPSGRYVAGVSALSSSSQGVLYAPHAILCCQ